MRLFSILALTTLLSAPAFAADLGTYRPGSPYHSVVAPGADVCESHCAGDAQCRGWNYVKVNPRAPGVCEFNSKSVSPIESAISISGAGGASIAPGLIQGNTNTVRVGTRPAPKPRANRVTVGRTPSGRRIVREAVSQRVSPSQTVARMPAQSGSLTAQQNKYRAATGHATPQAQRPAPQRGARLMRDPRIQAPQQAGPRFQHNLDGTPRGQMMARPTAPLARDSQMRGPQRRSPDMRNSQRRDAQGRPLIGVPIGQRAQPQAKPQAARRTAPLPQQRIIPKSSVNSPVTHSNGQQRLQAAAQRQAQLSYEQAQQSLFGSLNDDVQAPRPMVAPPADANAPIPTSQARPTQPVEQSMLGALAGG